MKTIIPNHDSTEWDYRAKILSQNYNKYVIYVLVNKINGKIYIGKSYNFHERLREHKNSYKSKRDLYIIRAFKKYGIGNFNIKVIESFSNFSDKRLRERENFWIDFYDTLNAKKGYNCVKHDIPNGICEITEEVRKKIGESSKNRDHSYNFRPVKQIDINTNEIINIFKSISAASEYIKGDRSAVSTISSVCNQSKEKGYIKKSACGFGWAFLEDDHISRNFKFERGNFKRKGQTEHLRQYVEKRKKPIQRIDIYSKQILDAWSCASKANRVLKLTKSTDAFSTSICKKCGKNAIVYGYYWRYVDDSLNKINIDEYNIFIKKKIVQIDKQTNTVINYWDSVKDAAINVVGNCKKSTCSAINQVCQGKFCKGYPILTAYGFKWEYVYA